MTVTRVKVTAYRLPSNFNSLNEKEKRKIKEENLQGMIKKLRRLVGEYGIPNALKKHEYYEKPSEKRRRLKRQQELQKLKNKRDRN